MQFYDITILIFGLSERDGLILDQCATANFLIQADKLFNPVINHTCYTKIEVGKRIIFESFLKFIAKEKTSNGN